MIFDHRENIKRILDSQSRQFFRRVANDRNKAGHTIYKGEHEMEMENEMEKETDKQKLTDLVKKQSLQIGDLKKSIKELQDESGGFMVLYQEGVRKMDAVVTELQSIRDSAKGIETNEERILFEGRIQNVIDFLED